MCVNAESIPLFDDIWWPVWAWPGHGTVWGPVPHSGRCLCGSGWSPALESSWPGPKGLWQIVYTAATAPRTPVETRFPPGEERKIAWDQSAKETLGVCLRGSPPSITFPFMGQCCPKASPTFIFLLSTLKELLSRFRWGIRHFLCAFRPSLEDQVDIVISAAFSFYQQGARKCGI